MTHVSRRRSKVRRYAGRVVAAAGSNVVSPGQGLLGTAEQLGSC